MREVGIYSDTILDDICPLDISKVTNAWDVVMPNMHDEAKVIQINNKYILRIGMQVTQGIILLSANYKLNYLKAIEISNAISYVFDTVCHVGFPYSKGESKAYLAGMKQYYKLMGKLHIRTIGDIEREHLDKYDILNSMLGDEYMRILPFSLQRGKNYSMDIPDNKKLLNAFFVYKQALLSTEPQGRILNYWRALEAVTTKSKRYNLIERFREHRLKPVKCFHATIPRHSDAEFNLIIRYRSSVDRYFNKLLYIYGNSKNVLDHYYKNRRCPSAHANSSVLYADNQTTLVSLYRDALFLKYLARCAIEMYWKNI